MLLESLYLMAIALAVLLEVQLVPELVLGEGHG